MAASWERLDDLMTNTYSSADSIHLLRRDHVLARGIFGICCVQLCLSLMCVLI